MEFCKYQALGNDYLVLEAAAWRELAPPLVRRLCDRHFGVGSDGILVREAGAQGDAFALRIFNPDGSEAEKSGNGLRIFARYLHDRGLVGEAPFAVRTPGGVVGCRILEGGARVEVEMGRVSFHSRDIPVAGPPREVLDETIEVAGESLLFSAATVGNPHCVLFPREVSRREAERLGPRLERHPSFPNRTNVQLVEVLGPTSIRIEIWERGAGYTLASGSSSCAAAAVACRLGGVGREIAVHMPGGTLDVVLDERMHARQTGPVGAVAHGSVARELIDGARSVRGSAP
jgi:diaminopimelate epimerase